MKLSEVKVKCARCAHVDDFVYFELHDNGWFECPECEYLSMRYELEVVTR